MDVGGKGDVTLSVIMQLLGHPLIAGGIDKLLVVGQGSGMRAAYTDAEVQLFPQLPDAPPEMTYMAHGFGHRHGHGRVDLDFR